MGYPPPPDDAAAALARRFHEAYERLAPDYGYRTREESAKPWEEVPAQNRALMIATCAEILEGPTACCDYRDHSSGPCACPEHEQTPLHPFGAGSVASFAERFERSVTEHVEASQASKPEPRSVGVLERKTAEIEELRRRLATMKTEMGRLERERDIANAQASRIAAALEEAQVNDIAARNPGIDLTAVRTSRIASFEVMAERHHGDCVHPTNEVMLNCPRCYARRMLAAAADSKGFSETTVELDEDPPDRQAPPSASMQPTGEVLPNGAPVVEYDLPPGEEAHTWGVREV